MVEETIGAKTGKFYRSLQSLIQTQLADSTSLNEYAQSLANTFDYNERFKSEQRKLHKQNETTLQRIKSAAKCYFSAQQDYCEYCKLNYWPSNCTVFIVPKIHLSYQSVKLLTKYKLLNYKPRYKSYKDILIQRILDRGLKLVYQCKRCKSKNLIFRELNRGDALKPIKVKQPKRRDQVVRDSLLKRYQLKKQQEAQAQNRQKASDPKLKIKKFQSLQSMLKKSELEEENLKRERERSQTSLSDFLQKLF